MTHSTARSHPGGFSHTVTISGTAVGTDQLQVLGYFLDTSTLIHYPCVFIQFLQAVLCLPDISVSVDASAIIINCSKSQLAKVLHKNDDSHPILSFFYSLETLLFVFLIALLFRFCPFVNFSFHFCNLLFSQFYFHILFLVISVLCILLLCQFVSCYL